MLRAASLPNVPVKLIFIHPPIPIFFILFSGMTASSWPPSQIFARIPPGRALTIPHSASRGIVGIVCILTPIEAAPIFASLFAMVMTALILSMIQLIDATTVALTVSHTHAAEDPSASHITFHAAFIGAARVVKVEASHPIPVETTHFINVHAPDILFTNCVHISDTAHVKALNQSIMIVPISDTVCMTASRNTYHPSIMIVFTVSQFL